MRFDGEMRVVARVFPAAEALIRRQLPRFGRDMADCTPLRDLCLKSLWHLTKEEMRGMDVDEQRRAFEHNLLLNATRVAHMLDSVVELCVKHEGDCCVCQLPIAGSAMRLVRCGHFMHARCTAEWLCHVEKLGATCPLCRDVVIRTT